VATKANSKTKLATLPLTPQPFQLTALPRHTSVPTVRCRLADDFGFMFGQRLMGHGGSRYGAGRPAVHVSTDDCRSLDVREIVRSGAMVDGGTWRWPDGRRATFGLGAECLVLRHDLLGRPTAQPLPLLRTECHYGGTRSWFGCASCHSRVAVLFLRPWGFGCRRCANVAYASGRESEMERADRAQRKAARRLGAEGQRPFGMHHATYLAVQERVAREEQRRNQAMADSLLLLLPRP
jgi:hypothetical protein